MDKLQRNNYTLCKSRLVIFLRLLYNLIYPLAYFVAFNNNFMREAYDGRRGNTKTEKKEWTKG
jgi:hypothetical protein